MDEETRKYFAEKMMIATRRVRTWDELTNEQREMVARLYHNHEYAPLYVYGLNMNEEYIHCRYRVGSSFV